MKEEPKEKAAKPRIKIGLFPQTVIATLVFFALLFILSTWSNSRGLTGLKIDPTLVVIALVPFIIWLIVSGKVQSFTLPGGLGIVLRNFAKQPISTEKDGLSMPIDVNPAVTSKKGGVDELHRKISQENPNTLSFDMQRGDYSNEAISKYLEYPNFRYVLFNDTKGNSKALMSAGDFKALHNTPGVDTVKEIESGRILRDSKTLPPIKEGSTNKEALSLMESEHTDTLSVIDAEGKHIGVVTRDALIKSLMAKLLTA